MGDDEQELSGVELSPEAESEEASVDESIADADASVSAKEAERLKIQSEIEEFLSRGGRITQVDENVMSDPPKRPESNYGGQPI